MAYCYEHALPHSQFLGGPPVWQPEDRIKIAAFALEKAERCYSCGTAAWEWAADNNAYVAVQTQCQGCMRREIKQQERPAGEPLPGTSVTLVTAKQAAALAAAHASGAVDSPAARRARRREREAQRA